MSRLVSPIDKAAMFICSLSPQYLLAGESEPILKKFVAGELPAINRFTYKSKIPIDKKIKEKLLTEDKRWKDMKPKELIFMQRGSYNNHSMTFDIIIATKKCFLDSGEYFDFASATESGRYDKSCVLVLGFELHFDKKMRGNLLDIDNRSVHQSLQRKGIMKRASIQILRNIYEAYGDMPVTNFVLHVATAFFLQQTKKSVKLY